MTRIKPNEGLSLSDKEIRATTPQIGERRASPGLLFTERHYRQLLINAVLSITAVAVFPLIVMTSMNYHQYQEAFHTESLRPVHTLTTNAKLSLEFFLSERLSALQLVINEKSLDDLRDTDKLKRLLFNMKQAFRGFVDLGLIDDNGKQISYAGPYNLIGKSYTDQEWFQEVGQRGVHISDVFMGHRNIPHFVIAILHETPDGGRYVLRATIDSEVLDRQVHGLIGSSTGDAFIVNQGGILQTPSLSCGGVLQNCNISIPPQSQQVDVVESVDSNSNAVILGFARIEKSPFIVVLRNHPSATQESWLSLRRELVGFLVISILLIVGVVVWGSWRMVNRTRDSDRKRAAIFHKMEYTNKMASIGRLAAGVAHEINNPLAIINEKAGLLKDLYSFSEQSPDREKVLGIIDSVLRSVERCGNITHRLLGFAKHMDVHNEDINLKTLLDEVLSFLGKESVHRGLTVNFEFSGTPPTIQSDRGQLQQVFLNIINNAFAAVEDGGQIDLSIAAEGTDHVVVGIADNGSGIPQEHLSRIFEPFFTTKKEYGTGLGLSITYGIVQKLGGKISVTSKVGTGTEFRITLPRKRNPQGEA